MRRHIALLIWLASIAFYNSPDVFAVGEEMKFYLIAGSANNHNFLSEEKGPGGISIQAFVLPGITASWKTTLTGDISGGKYGIGIFFASVSTTTFRVEILSEQDGNEVILASDTIVSKTANYTIEKRQLEGKDALTKAGDKLILRISHVEGGKGGVLYGSFDDDSYITIPPIVAAKSVSPLAGKWKGVPKDGGTLSFVVPPDREFVKNFTVKMEVPSDLKGAVKVEEVVEDALKIKNNRFKIRLGDSFYIVGTFTSPNMAMGTWVYSANFGPEAEGLCSATGTWAASFDTLAVSPKEKLATTWGKVKEGL